MKVAFLILHYNEIALTQKAIESIKNMKGDRSVVVVDNCSPNGSGKRLVDIYGASKHDYNSQPNDNKTVAFYSSRLEDVDLHIILNQENGGFSKGNNLGYRYIKQNLDVDFVVALNNDISFPQSDFIEVLDGIYTNDRFYLAGPDVYTPHIRSHISPIAKNVRGVKEIDSMIKINNDRISQAGYGLSLSTLFRYIQEKYQNTKILQFYNRLRKSQYSAALPYNEVAYGCVLNGACLIFDSRYVDEYDVLFEEKTFLYAEEDFLTFRLSKDEKVIRYCPELKVDHVGEGSAGYTKMNYSRYIEKIKKTSKVVNESLLVYRNYIK